MDEDELKEVYEHGLITKEDYENAYNIANKIISTYNSHKEDYYEFIYNYTTCFVIIFHSIEI